MSQYAALDALIVGRITEQTVQFTPLFACKPIKAECDRLEAALGREAFRILDGRLQALRKKGVITYGTKAGWSFQPPSRGIEMSQIDVGPTVETINKMAESLRDAAAQLDAIAENTKRDGNFRRVGDAASCVANLIPNLRLDLLVVRLLRQFKAC